MRPESDNEMPRKLCTTIIQQTTLTLKVFQLLEELVGKLPCDAICCQVQAQYLLPILSTGDSAPRTVCIGVENEMK